MKKLIKVSVLTPIYNHNPEYVRKCLESLHKQTLKEIEFVLLDNEAIPESKQLIDEFCKKDKRFKCIHIEKNQGYGHAMNLGLDAACGEYIGIVESDDFIEPDMYEKLYEIGCNTKVDIVKGLFNFFEENEIKSVGLSFIDYEYNRVLKNLDVPDYCYKYGAYWSAIYSKRMIDKYNIRYEEQPQPSGEDIMWTLKTYFFCDGLYITDKSYYNHRMDNPNSSIRGKDERIKLCMDLYLKLNEYLDNQLKYMKPEYWNIKTRREFLNFWWAYKGGFIKKHKLKLLKIASRNFKYNLKHTVLHLGQLEAKIYKSILKHPVLFGLRNILFGFGSDDVKLFGLSLYSKQINEDIKTKKYLYGLMYMSCFKDSRKTISFLGIPVYQTKRINGFGERRIFGICVKTAYSNRNIFKYLNSMEEYTKNVMDARLRYIHYDLNSKLYAQSVHPNTFGKYRCCNTGKDVYLIACGPTLKFFDGKKDKNAVFVGVNRSFLHSKIKLDYLMIQDNLGDEMQSAIDYNPKTCKKFFGIIPHNRLNVCKNTPRFEHINCVSLAEANQANAGQYILNEYPVDYWPYDISIEPIRDCGGTVMSAMQFILYTNPKRIFLVGCDCSDGGHFYGGRIENFSDAVDLWRNMKKYLLMQFPNTEIISVNPIGLRGMFNDIYTKEFLKDNPEIQDVEFVK